MIGAKHQVFKCEFIWASIRQPQLWVLLIPKSIICIFIQVNGVISRLIYIRYE